MAAPGRRIRQRRDATGAPTQGPGFRESESPLQLALSVQESWRESDKSRVREGCALAVKSLFPYDAAAVLVRQLRGPHLST